MFIISSANAILVDELFYANFGELSRPGRKLSFLRVQLAQLYTHVVVPAWPGGLGDEVVLTLQTKCRGCIAGARADSFDIWPGKDCGVATCKESIYLHYQGILSLRNWVGLRYFDYHSNYLVLWIANLRYCCFVYLSPPLERNIRIREWNVEKSFFASFLGQEMLLRGLCTQTVTFVEIGKVENRKLCAEHGYLLQRDVVLEWPKCLSLFRFEEPGTLVLDLNMCF